MSVILAVKTLEAIERASRQPDFHTAYKEESANYVVKGSGPRGHMGASGIGDSCPRKIWYGFRWVNGTEEKASPRIIRLWQRGDIEEFRFVALLRLAGIQVFAQDEKGKQYGFKENFFGGSTDGVALGVPDLPPNLPTLLEFKTHNDKSFTKLTNSGVAIAKPEHWVQMITYIDKLKLGAALYLAVNKNDDTIYGEIIMPDPLAAKRYNDRAVFLIQTNEPPPRIHDDPTWFQCRFCDMHAVCHMKQEPARSCRTCEHGNAGKNGMWACNLREEYRDLEEQLAGCDKYVKSSSLST